jgi:hypothetical protein
MSFLFNPVNWSLGFPFTNPFTFVLLALVIWAVTYFMYFKHLTNEQVIGTAHEKRIRILLLIAHVVFTIVMFFGGLVLSGGYVLAGIILAGLYGPLQWYLGKKQEKSLLQISMLVLSCIVLILAIKLRFGT